MKKINLILYLAFFISITPNFVSAQNISKAVFNNIKQPNLIGNSDLKFLGLKVYNISLWSEDKIFSYNNEFAIQINYNMNFSREDLAKRSIEEIKKNNYLSEKEEKNYYQELIKIFVNIKKGDEKVALFSPNQGVTLFYNNQIIGKISDLKFARLFVDIWLDERGSYPKTTRNILGKI
jgi:hypothetical protein